METTATILHAHLDAFYASVEQLLEPHDLIVGVAVVHDFHAGAEEGR